MLEIKSSINIGCNTSESSKEESVWRSSFDDQFQNLLNSVYNFDLGETNEAARIAVIVRILFHETSMSKPHFSGDRKNIYILSSKRGLGSGLEYQGSQVTRLYVCMRNNAPQYYFLPNFNEFPLNPVKLDDWWREDIFYLDKNAQSRKDIVLILANKGGGAHIELNIKDRTTAKLLSNEFTVEGTGNAVDRSDLVIPISIQFDIRQIAFELMNSPDFLRCLTRNKLREYRSKWQSGIHKSMIWPDANQLIPDDAIYCTAIDFELACND